MARAILIDTPNKRLQYIDIEDWHGIAPALDCRLFSRVVLQHDEDRKVDAALYVDDEGLLSNPNPNGYFRIGNYPQVLAGKGLIFVEDFDGETTYDVTGVMFRAVEAGVTYVDDPAPEDIEPKFEVYALNS